MSKKWKIRKMKNKKKFPKFFCMVLRFEIQNLYLFKFWNSGFIVSNSVQFREPLGLIKCFSLPDYPRISNQCLFFSFFFCCNVSNQMRLIQLGSDELLLVGLPPNSLTQSSWACIALLWSEGESSRLYCISLVLTTQTCQATIKHWAVW